MAERQKVLIVEDNADLRRLYAIGLNQHGYEVKLAANGAEALDRIESEKPDVILLDLLMPIMDGWELMSKVNPIERSPQVPIVVITGEIAPVDHPLQPCIVGWVSKPATIEEVVEALANVPPPNSDSSMIPPSGQAGPNHRTSASH